MSTEPLRIFYSWQSDTPEERKFIRAALDKAVDIVGDEMKLDEADRPIVDQDTQGKLGSPPIAETIFEKIDDADVVVVDVTLTGRTESGKALINSNAAYELGYAHGTCEDEVLLKVMNTFYGGPEMLPFDLRHRRWPVQFALDPKADKTTREKVQRNLAKDFAGILRLYVEAKRPPPEPFERTLSNGNPAVYWRQGDPLVDLGRRQLIAPIDAPMVYLRLSPTSPVQPLSGVQIADPTFTHVRPLIAEAVAHSSVRNDYGMIHYSPHEARPEQDEGLPDLLTWTQVFRNREIWGVSAVRLHSVWREQIVMDHLEHDLIDGLQEYLRKAEAFHYPPLVHFEAGIVHVRGMRVLLATGGRLSDPLRETFITHGAQFNRHDPTAWKAPLLTLFEKIFDEGAQVRPTNLRGFPGTE